MYLAHWHHQEVKLQGSDCCRPLPDARTSFEQLCLHEAQVSLQPAHFKVALQQTTWPWIGDLLRTCLQHSDDAVSVAYTTRLGDEFVHAALGAHARDSKPGAFSLLCLAGITAWQVCSSNHQVPNAITACAMLLCTRVCLRGARQAQHGVVRPEQTLPWQRTHPLHFISDIKSVATMSHTSCAGDTDRVAVCCEHCFGWLARSLARSVECSSFADRKLALPALEGVERCHSADDAIVGVVLANSCIAGVGTAGGAHVADAAVVEGAAASADAAACAAASAEADVAGPSGNAMGGNGRDLEAGATCGPGMGAADVPNNPRPSHKRSKPDHLAPAETLSTRRRKKMAQAAGASKQGSQAAACQKAGPTSGMGQVRPGETQSSKWQLFQTTTISRPLALV